MRKRARKPRVMKVTKRVLANEMASMTQLISFNSATGSTLIPTTNFIYGLYNFSLTTCDRAVRVAKAYQLYRISKVEIKFKPKYDTFIAGATQAAKGYLYYIVDRTGSMYNSNTNFNSLRDAGARPLVFDEKTRTVSFAPAILNQVLDAGTNVPPPTPFAQYKVSPWLTTNAYNLQSGQPWEPNSTDHLGISFGVETEGPLQYSYDVDIVIHYQFKKPRNESTGATVPWVRVDLNDLAYPEPASGIPAQDT